MTILDKIKSFFKNEKDSTNSIISPYQKLGGEEILRELVTSFYHHMDTLFEAKECRDLHPKSLKGSEEKLFMFLSGWLGGPSLYIEKYGHPRMRMRHMPFKIGEREKDQWLLCMHNALKALELESDLEQELWQAFRRFAQHMVNSK